MQIARLLTSSLGRVVALLDLSILFLLLILSVLLLSFFFRFVLANFVINLQRCLFSISLVKLLLPLSSSIYFQILLAKYNVASCSAFRRLTLASNAVFLFSLSFASALLLFVDSLLVLLASSAVSRLALVESTTPIFLS